MQSGNVIIEIE